MGVVYGMALADRVTAREERLPLLLHTNHRLRVLPTQEDPAVHVAVVVAAMRLGSTTTQMSVFWQCVGRSTWIVVS